MRDTDWYIIHELYKVQNITKAANHLFIGQPTLTKRIQYMEEELNVRLVNRSTKGVTFTREGEFLARQAMQYVQMWEETRRCMEQFREDGFGTIRIVSSYTYSKYHLPEIILQFRQMYPNVAFDVQFLKSDEVIRFLEEGKADVIFVRGEYECDLQRRMVLSEQAYLIASEPVALTGLREMSRVDSILGNHTRAALNRWWSEKFTEQPRVNITVRDADTCWQMARRGLGYTIGFFSPAQLKELDMYYIPLYYEDGKPVERSTWFLYSDRYPKASYINHFVSFLNNLCL